MERLRAGMNRIRVSLNALSDRFAFDWRGLVPAVLLLVSVTLLVIKLATNPHLFIGKQSILVRGRLICCLESRGALYSASQNRTANKTKSRFCRPAIATAVELYDYDYLTPSDLLNGTLTDRDGRFELSAEVNELSTAWPYILVYNRCDVDPQFHQPEHSMKEKIVRKSHYAIPQHYINSGRAYVADPLNLVTRGWRDFHA